MINVEVNRQVNETTGSLLRRFSKRVSGAGLIRHVKAGRFAERAQSYFKRKRSALIRLERRAAHERLRKLGKI